MHITYRDIYTLIGGLSLQQLDTPVQIIDDVTGEISPIISFKLPEEDLLTDSDSEPVFLVKA